MATIQTVNIGTSANDNTGDTLRNAFDKTNQNNTALNNDLATKAPLASPTFTGIVTTVNDAVINSIMVGRGGGNVGTNTTFGNLALFSNYSGYQNTAIGNQSLYNNGNGYYNTAIGVLSLSNNIGFANCTGVGYNSQVTGDGQVQLGNSSTTTYVYGTVQNRSDLRDKADVQDTILGLDFISKLRPVDYKWNLREDYFDSENDGSKKRNRFHHGFIAQEVKDLGFGGFQDHSINGGEDVLSIGYDEFIAPMVRAIQELKAEIELLKSK